MKSSFIILFFIFFAGSVQSQNLCWIIGDYVSVDDVKTNSMEIDTLPTLPMEIDSFRVIDMCTVGPIRLIELRRADDSLGYENVSFDENFTVRIPTGKVIITLDEDVDLEESLIVGDVYLMEVKPFFSIKRLMGDAYCSLIIGVHKKVVVEVQFPPHGNFYTSPNIVGRYYIPVSTK